MIRIVVLACLFAAALSACGGRDKVSMSGEDDVKVGDFIEFFPEVDLPYTIADTVLAGRPADSALIAWTVLTRFLPDTVFAKEFGEVKPKVYALGRTREKNKESYLFLKAVNGARRVAYVVTLDDKNKYLNRLVLVSKGFNSNTFAYGSIDKKFQISTYKEMAAAAGTSNYKRNVYIYNNAANDFTLILTEPNQEFMDDILNPIDTLPQKNKYTGDYVYNKKNFLSFRDGKTPSQMQFFIHFEKVKGECIGELKGTARFVSAKKAVYNESGNPCTLEFTFSNTAVVMKETEGCGTYRGIKCFFEGTYPKQKTQQTKK